MSTATAAVVHRELPGFKAFREFCYDKRTGTTRHDTCAQCAATTMLAAIDPAHWSADCDHMNVIAEAMIANGRLSGGTTMSNLVLQLQDMGYRVDYAPWEHWHPTLALDLLHQLLKELSGVPGMGILLEVGQAHNLPRNEQNVFSHFIADGGIDSLKGYLIANGDEPVTLFRGTEWVGWDALVAAQPTAICVVQVKPAPVVGVRAVLEPAGWTDSANWTPGIAGELYAPNGFKYIAGNRAHVLAQPTWNPSNFPVMNEASDGTVSCQVNTLTTLEWSQVTGVIEHPNTPISKVMAAFANFTSRPVATPRQLAVESWLASQKTALASLLESF